MHTNRLKEVSSVTVLTVICLLIVLVLHHASYTLDLLSPIRTFHIHKILQRFAVGGFIFLSGFKLTKAKLDASVKNFILNRISKIYGLYLFAVILFSFTAYPHLNEDKLPSLGNFVLHAVALQSIFPGYFGRNFHTLWFISVLFLCYFTFLVLRRKLMSQFQFILWSTALITLIFLTREVMLRFGILVFQADLEIWLVIFCFGMMCAVYDFYYLFSKSFLVATVTMLLGFLELAWLYNFSYEIEQVLFKLLELVGITMAFFPIYASVVKSRLKLPPQIGNAFRHITVASYCMFLFHRPIWTVLTWFWSERSIGQALFIWGLGVPLIFAFSYFVQTKYSIILGNKLENKIWDI